MTRRQLAASLCIAASVAVLTPLEAATAAQTNFCLRTARAGLDACKAGARSDRSLAEGKCANLPDSSSTKSCNAEAAADALDTCREQHKLRKDVCDRLGPAPYAPVINPANFVATIDNPFFPLTPGTTFIYEGPTEDGFEHVDFAVTHNTKVILGVTCIEVHDTAKLDGVLHEDTRDWFAQDTAGNVWYFGENTAIVENGLPVSLEGSWTGGVDGAQPGIIMKAHPAVGDFYRQEFLLGEAEDLAEVVSLSATATVPAGSFDPALETEESSPLSPGDVEHKFYAAGVGNVLTIDLATGDRSELVAITTE